MRALRFGWYGGALARLVWTSSAIPGLRQHAPVVRAHSMVVAPWRPSLTLSTAGWPPGSYLLRLDAVSGLQRFVPLVIRSPSVAGRLVLVQPTASFQAYNGWGGYDLYQGPDGSYATRARVVSFDRPYSSAAGAGSFFQEEQPLLSYAERLGLPLAYVTSVDLDLHPHLLDGATGVVSEAHDEYWSPGVRATVTRCRSSPGRRRPVTGSPSTARSPTMWRAAARAFSMRAPRTGPVACPPSSCGQFVPARHSTTGGAAADRSRDPQRALGVRRRPAGRVHLVR